MDQSPPDPDSPFRPSESTEAGNPAAKPEWAYAAEYQRKTDIEHLNLLSIFYFVMGGLALFGALAQCAMLAVMGAFLAGTPVMNQPGAPAGAAPPPEFIVFMASFFGCIVLLVLAQGTLNVLSGLGLRKRKNRTLSLVAGALNCLSIPFGLALGVFTFIVLSRDSVKRLYEEEERGSLEPNPSMVAT